jgi:hypothetical protein
MTEAAFKKKVEPFLHIIPNLYATVGALYLLFGQYFNSVGDLCWIGGAPSKCIEDSGDVECIGGDDKVYAHRWIFFDSACYLAFVIITMNMMLIILAVVKQKNRNARWGLGLRQQHEGAVVVGRRHEKLRPIKERNAEGHIDNSRRRRSEPPSLLLPASCSNQIQTDISTNATHASMPPLKYEDPHAFDPLTVRAKAASERLNSSLSTPSTLRISTRRKRSRRRTTLEVQGRDVVVQSLLFISSFVVSWVFVLSAQ